MEWPITRAIRCVDWLLFFFDMTENEQVETDENTGEEETHAVRACPEKYSHDIKVVWMTLIKVVRTEGEKVNE